MAPRGREQGAARTDRDGALDDHGAIGLVDDAIDLLQVVRVPDDLVSGDDVLFENGAMLAADKAGGYLGNSLRLQTEMAMRVRSLTLKISILTES
jgi:hypothetical protein